MRLSIILITKSVYLASILAAHATMELLVRLVWIFTHFPMKKVFVSALQSIIKAKERAYIVLQDALLVQKEFIAILVLITPLQIQVEVARV